MRLSCEEYRALVEQAPIMIWRAGLDALCDYFNERWLTFRGRTQEQEAGNGWAEGVHPEDMQACLETYLSSFHRRVAFEMYYRLKRRDGVYRWIFDRGVPVFDAQDAFAGYVGSCIDVTERIEAQEAMRLEKERELRQLRGLLPVCSQCKKIRNETGGWEDIEFYVASRTQAEFTHGYCPGCAEEIKAQFRESIR